MCGGATQQQKQISDEQNAFYKELTSEYSVVFGEHQDILKHLTDAFTPILEAGPDQRGFTGEERTALQTQINDRNSDNFAQAQTALEARLNARGGTDAGIHSGADDQLTEELAGLEASERSREELKTTEADFATGRDMFDEATRALSSTAGLLNPTSFAGQATGAGSAASQTAKDIADADNAMWGSVFSGLGGIAGAAVGSGGIATKAGH